MIIWPTACMFLKTKIIVCHGYCDQGGKGGLKWIIQVVVSHS